MIRYIRNLFRSRSAFAPPGAWTGTDDLGLTSSRTSAGQQVTEESAYAYSALYNAFTLIAEAIGIMANNVFRSVESGKTKIIGHPLRPIIHQRANPEQSAQQFRELLQGWCLAWGNGYAEIQRSTTGQPVALWPIAPNRVDVRRDPDQTIPATQRNPIVYVIRSKLNKVEAVIPAEDMFHIKNFSGDGVVGFSIVQLARESIGLGLATEQFGANFFGNAAHPAGIIKTAKVMDPDAKRKLKDRWLQGHSGQRALGVAILDEGMDWTQIGIPPEDAQFLQTRVFQIDEIARWTKVPPTMLAELSRAHFKNIEHLSIQFVTRALLPWVSRWEHETNWKLLTRSQRDASEFTKMNVDSQLRGDTATRRDFYKVMNAMGVFTINDILELEDRNTIGDDGDQRFVPMNMVPLDSARQVAEGRGTPPPPPSSSGPPAFGQIAEKSAMRTTHTQMQMILGKEANAAKRRVGKVNASDRAVEFYNKHVRTMDECLNPFALSLCESILGMSGVQITADNEDRIGFVVTEFCQAHCHVSLRSLEQAVSHNKVDELCESWLITRSVEATKELVERVASCTMAMSQKGTEDVAVAYK